MSDPIVITRAMVMEALRSEPNERGEYLICKVPKGVRVVIDARPGASKAVMDISFGQIFTRPKSPA